MKTSTRATATLTALIVIALLACSPSAIVREVFGENQVTPAGASPTNIAQAATPSMTSTAEPTPTLIPTTTPGATQTAAPTNTPPPVLALRDDLPALTLRDWPRPANDNGRCIHFLPTGYYTPRDFEIQVPRLVGLQMRWTLALYSDENQLRLAATRFKEAGIVGIWRKSMRAYQRYSSWDRDIQILNQIGVPPYMQVYNEPDVEAEWDGRPVNGELWFENFLQSARDIYNAGGYVGVQVLDEDWLRVMIREIKARKGERMFGRMFFVPHPYGLNHPPSYVEDDNTVTGFRGAAGIFQSQVGFVPPFIAGEGGWKFKAAEDNRFPIVDDKLHAAYHVELFNWFRTGQLSDGKPLPDYLFAFCPWILAGQLEGAAWYDSFEGNRELTIAEVKKIPIFTRKFSWTK